MGISERKEREKERRRIEIIEAAEKVFFGRGGESASMESIAEQAELSKGTLYLYFKSREDLLYAVFLRGMDILKKMMQEQIKNNYSGLENLKELGKAFVAFSKNHEDYFNLFTYFQTSDIERLNMPREKLQSHIIEESPLALVTQCVKQGIHDGSLRNDIPVNEFAFALWTQLMGVVVVAKNKKGIYELYNISEDQIIDTHFNIVIHGGKR
ncbi:MAG: TetR/AcrR family transcriptional regulator [Bacteroidales bacterium]|nr:TetR/AcrR family transcriptional regulator [Bacteroidales bacterium]